MIEQVLFTSPGERVNRPDFGSGLLQLVFQPLSSELVTTNQYLVQGALNQWLGDLIEVSAVEVTREDAMLQVTVAYTVLKTQQPQTAQFTR
jgi:phage baseplate assembly protein W